MKNIEAIEFTLTKTTDYTLKPFGKFKLKWCPSKSSASKPNIIGVNDVSFDSNAGMPYTEEQHKIIAGYMIKHKTDVLINTYGDCFTFMSSRLVQIRNEKISLYKKYLDQREENDCPETWNNYINRM